MPDFDQNQAGPMSNNYTEGQVQNFTTTSCDTQVCHNITVDSLHEALNKIEAQIAENPPSYLEAGYYDRCAPFSMKLVDPYNNLHTFKPYPTGKGPIELPKNSEDTAFDHEKYKETKLLEFKNGAKVTYVPDKFDPKAEQDALYDKIQVLMSMPAAGGIISQEVMDNIIRTLAENTLSQEPEMSLLLADFFDADRD